MSISAFGRCLLLGIAPVVFCLADDHYLFRFPTVSSTEIVFSYAGDLWSVPRGGGEARQLTSHPGTETNPFFSPDGKSIAFSGEYDGGTAVYVMPAAGGTPTALTWNHAEKQWPVGWTPDGKRVLYCSFGNAFTDRMRLYTVDLEGGYPAEVPLPLGSQGSYSADGLQLAYVPLFQYQYAWKRYRGGQMGKIWIAKLADSSVVPVPHGNGNDLYPMWMGGKIYFLSDRNGPVTLFSYDMATRQVKQLIENRGFDFKSAGAGPGAIVYEQFGSIGLYDIASGKAKIVPIRVAGEFPQSRARRLDVGSRLGNPDVSPNGIRAAFEARGEVITLPANQGDARNLTNSPGAHEREPMWSPKGDRIAYFSDESGDYQLYVRDQSGMGEPKKFRLGDKPGYFMGLRWSPDGEKVSYIDAHLNLWYLDLEKKTPVLVDKDYAMPFSGAGYGNRFWEFVPAWSPDNKWLAYARLQPNAMRAIWVYSLEDGSRHQMTDGMSDARNPAFDRNYKYLYFTSSTNSGPASEVDLRSYGASFVSHPYLIVLRKQNSSPFLAESDEENIHKENVIVSPIRIDFDNLPDRTIPIPMPNRPYSGLQAGPSGILFALAGDGILRYDVGARQEKAIMSGATDITISANGSKMLYKKDGNWMISDADGSGNNTVTLNRDGLDIAIDPKSEWRQIYREAFLIMREFFYEPGFHGQDMDALEKRYAPFLDNLASRQDLNYLLEEAFGNLSVGHLFVEGGDWPDPGHQSTGLLGADFTVENGRYRFKRVYSGENWNPDTRSPLTRPGVNVQPGEYLLAVNGRELTGSQNVYKFFEGLADKQVVLTVGPDPTGESKTRQIRVRPVGDEHAMRYAAWIEDNRRAVDRLSSGRLAYVHMPDTGPDGETSFIRYYYAQTGKEGAIIDDRFNHGGHWATDIIEHLQRHVATLMISRDGADAPMPMGIYGPKAMVINEYSASGGDAMPWYFQHFGLGKLVGETTWGGIVGNMWVPSLVDGGSMKVPCCFGWNVAGKPVIENHGTVPDMEVPMDPKAVREGHDPQLEKAVEVVMEELAKHPVPVYQRPEFPRYK